jgi:hypothetical protein
MLEIPVRATSSSNSTSEIILIGWCDLRKREIPIYSLEFLECRFITGDDLTLTDPLFNRFETVDLCSMYFANLGKYGEQAMKKPIAISGNVHKPSHPML